MLHNVTLACEEGMPFLVHKMILVVSSVVSVGILRKDPHQYPLVYMRGGGTSTQSEEQKGQKIEYLRTAPLKQLTAATGAAARAAIEIGYTTEETVNANEITPEPVEETEPAENAEISEKSVNAAEISSST